MDIPEDIFTEPADVNADTVNRIPILTLNDR
ncbi:hypothetical protein KC8_13335 [Sphingomonas sp. KC8]|nr:hypothetical protein KC8_13335 [Sphingomonas sp. KC8]